MKDGYRIAVLGAGNIGTSIARGLVQSGHFSPSRIVLARRRTHLLEEFRTLGFEITNDNLSAVESCDVLLVAVEPQRVDALLDQIAPWWTRRLVISVVTGVSIRQLEARLRKGVPSCRPYLTRP